MTQQPVVNKSTNEIAPRNIVMSSRTCYKFYLKNKEELSGMEGDTGKESLQKSKNREALDNALVWILR